MSLIRRSRSADVPLAMFLFCVRVVLLSPFSVFCLFGFAYVSCTKEWGAVGLGHCVDVAYHDSFYHEQRTVIFWLKPRQRDLSL